MNPLNLAQNRHRVLLAGFIQDELTKQRISGVILKICQAPDLFVQRLVTQVRVFGLPSSWIRWRSPPQRDRVQSAPQVLQDFYAQIENPQIRSTMLLNHLQELLIAPNLETSHKLLAIQTLLDAGDIKSKPTTPYGRTQSARDGWFYFTDLPPGLYQLEAALPYGDLRYGKRIFTAEIKDLSQKLPHEAAFSDILKLKVELSPTTLFGKVCDATSQEIIDNAQVNLTESQSHTLTSRQLQQDSYGQWNYRLIAIDPIQPQSTLQVSAPGYETQQQQIELQPGEIKQCDFQLIAQS